jgi:hypothetical protein
MYIDNQSKINDYIKKFKGTKNLFKSYNEFDLEWLNSFDKELTDKVILEFDWIIKDRIYGDRFSNDMVIDDFIISLENLLKN